MKTLELPEDIKDYIESYRSLDLGGQKVCTPYYRNVKRIRQGLRVLGGKGSPEEITEEAKIYGMLRDFELHSKTPSEIREFMETQGIGIDCSGFVAQVINHWLIARGEQYIAHHLTYPRLNLLRKLVAKIRYIENISANLLTGKLNCKKINISDVRPGDLIRLRGVKHGFHVVMLSKVELDDSNSPISFTYVQSAEKYGRNNGIKYGEVRIKDVNAELKDQKWLEIDEDGVNWTHKGLLREYEDNGLRRLKFSELLT